MLIRAETSGDYATVYEINAAAFETTAEANLVEVLRKEAHPIISLVAEEAGKIIGHIMFSPVTLSGHEHLHIMGLGPMAVLQEVQGKGIGSALVKLGLEECGALGYGAVIVLGHPWFYPKFGFQPSTQFSIRSEYAVSEDVFMAMELEGGILKGASGVIHYHTAFNDV
jgi:putative acetyltransferase